MNRTRQRQGAFEGGVRYVALFILALLIVLLLAMTNQTLISAASDQVTALVEPVVGGF